MPFVNQLTVKRVEQISRLPAMRARLDIALVSGCHTKKTDVFVALGTDMSVHRIGLATRAAKFHQKMLAFRDGNDEPARALQYGPNEGV